MTSAWEDGNPQSKVCILGEAPSYVEIRQKKPLVGPSGQLLESCLHSAKLTRRDCYIVNLFPFEVTKDKTGNTIYHKIYKDVLWTKKNGLTTDGEEAVQESLQLVKQSGANVVLLLGRTVLDAILGDNRIMKLRGSIYYSELLEKKVIPTVHPAASLRGNYIWRYFIMSDLDKVRTQSASPEVKYPDRELIIDPSMGQVMDYLDECKSQKVASYDIEVTNHQMNCIAFSFDPSSALCIPFADERHQPMWSADEEVVIMNKVAGVLQDPEVCKVGQNLMFDMSFLYQQNDILPQGPIHDTMIAHHIIWPDFPKGLDFLCSIHTDEPYYKDEGKQWKAIKMDMEQWWLYNCKDAACTLEVWDMIEPDLDKGYRETYDMTIALFPSLMFMQAKGMKVNKERLDQTKKDVTALIEETEKELVEASDYEFNVNSPKQCQEYFYGHKGIKPYINRKTGNPTTDDKALSRIIRRFNLKEARIVQQLRSLKKLYSTYLDVGISPDGRIHCSYNPRGTWTGRLSSSQTILGEGMNMQNLDPRFKEFLEADDDR